MKHPIKQLYTILQIWLINL